MCAAAGRAAWLVDRSVMRLRVLHRKRHAGRRQCGSFMLRSNNLAGDAEGIAGFEKGAAGDVMQRARRAGREMPTAIAEQSGVGGGGDTSARNRS